ncbi:MAG: DUF2284 domain-containing protein [Deltaproteobacteria bacterium]|nr:DUF2284 domain-containing protein [Deltaproteobacteria bacterium]
MKPEKVVTFKDQGDIPKSLIQFLHEKGKDYGVREVRLFLTNKIVVSEWVNLKCRYGCNQYGTSWCCPPATPSLKKVRKILEEYSSALLLVGNQNCPEFYLNNTTKRAKQVRYWKGAVSLERALFLKGYYKAFSLVGVTCGLCKKCAYPENCLFPKEKRPTVESFSIDMIGTLKNIGIIPKVATHSIDSFDSYAIILLQ